MLLISWQINKVSWVCRHTELSGQSDCVESHHKEMLPPVSPHRKTMKRAQWRWMPTVSRGPRHQYNTRWNLVATLSIWKDIRQYNQSGRKTNDDLQPFNFKLSSHPETELTKQMGYKTYQLDCNVVKLLIVICDLTVKHDEKETWDNSNYWVRYGTINWF